MSELAVPRLRRNGLSRSVVVTQVKRQAVRHTSPAAKNKKLETLGNTTKKRQTVEK